MSRSYTSRYARSSYAEDTFDDDDSPFPASAPDGSPPALSANDFAAALRAATLALTDCLISLAAPPCRPQLASSTEAPSCPQPAPLNPQPAASLSSSFIVPHSSFPPSSNPLSPDHKTPYFFNETSSPANGTPGFPNPASVAVGDAGVPSPCTTPPTSSFIVPSSSFPPQPVTLPLYWRSESLPRTRNRFPGY